MSWEHGIILNKAARYYFSDALQVTYGDIYLSKLDLNVEHGQIESPFKPMLRIATQVRDNSGQLAGIVIINLLGQTLLEQIKIAAEGDQRFWLLNADGCWLLSDRVEMEWGFMFAGCQQQTISQQYPQIRALLNDQQDMQYHWLNDSLVIAAQYSLHLDRQPWWMVMTIMPGQVNQAQLVLNRIYWFSYLFFVMLSLSLFWVVRHLQVRQKLAQSQSLVTAEKLYSEHLQQQVKAQTLDLQQAKDRAESANRHKSEFLANISHELRTPMHAIMSFSHIGAKATTDPKTLRYFNNIHVSGERLTKLLDNLLNLAKFESGRMPISFERGNIRERINKAIEDTRSLLNDKQLTVNLLGDMSIHLDMDNDLILQILINLLSNAIKFSETGSEIDIAYTLRKSRDGLLSSDFLRLEIRDYGVDIPDSEVDSVFEKFTQSSKTMTGAGGTGLGLTICRQIIEQHHGRIYAVSPPLDGGKGSVFLIDLPVQQLNTDKISIADLYDYHLVMKQQVEDWFKSDREVDSYQAALFHNHGFCRIHENPGFSHLPARTREHLLSLHQSFHDMAFKLVGFLDKNEYLLAKELLPNFQSIAASFLNILKAIDKSGKHQQKRITKSTLIGASMIMQKPIDRDILLDAVSAVLSN